MNTVPHNFGDFCEKVFSSRNWGVYLHPNQSYLGRLLIPLESRICEDPLEITANEQMELWSQVLPKVQSVLRTSFQSDRLNYSMLGNTTHQVHWHVVPRYEKDPIRIFSGTRFEDTKVGKHYAPAPEGVYKKEVIAAIASILCKNLPR